MSVGFLLQGILHILALELKANTLLSQAMSHYMAETLSVHSKELHQREWMNPTCVTKVKRLRDIGKCLTDYGAKW